MIVPHDKGTGIARACVPYEVLSALLNGQPVDFFTPPPGGLKVVWVDTPVTDTEDGDPAPQPYVYVYVSSPEIPQVDGDEVPELELFGPESLVAVGGVPS